MAEYPVHYTVKDYYNRFDPAKNYEKILARAGYRIQSAETNDMQEAFLYRLKTIADALFRDGAIISGAQVAVDAQSGETRAEAGVIYLAGGMRQVPAKSFTIPLQGEVSIGVYLRETVISELEDPALRNPALGVRGEGDAGAWRLRVEAGWGFYGDGGAGAFYPVYTADSGVLRARDIPPSLDAVNLAIARYDRDSTAGGNYIVEGLAVRAAEMTGAAQAYTVAEGRAQVSGFRIELPTSRRLPYAAAPDLRFVDTEIHTADGEAVQRIDVAHAPLRNVTQLRITKQKTVNVVHGAYAGAADTLPDTAVVSILECGQGDTVYEANADYLKSGDAVNWSPGGNEPAPGSTYACTYTYMAAAAPEEQDYDGFFVSGAVAGSSIILSYNQALPRVDRLCLTVGGEFVFLKGVPAEVNSRPPAVPAGMLGLAALYQQWRGGPALVENDGVRVISFSTLEALGDRLNFALSEIARTRLEADVSTREAGARAGIFVDPLLDDSMRDQGITQSAAIVNGELRLPIAATLAPLTALAEVAVPPYTPTVALAQLLRTGGMRVNPYLSFDVPAARVTLNPAIDQGTDIETQWTSAITKQFDYWIYAPNDPRHGQTLRDTASTTELLNSESKEREFLREIPVDFSIQGFGPGEILRQVIFDGVTAKFTADAADASGALKGRLEIPPRIPSGAKTVLFKGEADGSAGEAVFIGQRKLTVQTVRQVNTVSNRHIDPLAQTFTPERTMRACGADLFFTAKADGSAPGADPHPAYGEVRVQIREVRDGVPTAVILAEAHLSPARIVVTGGGHTRALFDVPAQLQAGTEYALVILCNDPDTAVAIAEMGEFDATAQKWVSAQAYNVGVLLSSSNASTWTAHQDKDLTFRLLEATFTSVSTTVELGEATVQDASDLVIFAVDERPAVETAVEYILAAPDGKNHTLDRNQPLRFPAPLTGPVSVTARLKGSANAAPLLWPGAALLVGAVARSADYYSRSIPALSAVRAVVIYDALIPSGAGVTVEIQVDSGDNGGAWEPLQQTGAVHQGEGLVEYSHEAALTNANWAKVRFILTGDSAARPSVRNIRFMTLK